MKVAILFSGGKDSAYAIEHALSRGWEISYLLTVVPTRKDCYLFHYATTQNALVVGEMMGIKHLHIKCDIADPIKEAELVKSIVEKNKVDALILGGVGLQETQLKSLQTVLLPLGVEVFAAHAGHDHGEMMQEMLDKGYRFIISQIASDGLTDWLGREITKQNFEQLKKDSEKYGFHLGFEGGYADTFCVDAPYYPKRIAIIDAEKVYDGDYTGHVVIKSMALVQKKPQIKKQIK